MDVRVVIVQPIVPHYRVPVFEHLARVPGIRLTVAADLGPAEGSLEGIGHSDVFALRHSPCVKVGPLIRQDGMKDVAEDPAFDVVVFTWDSRRYQLPRAIRTARRQGKGVVLWGHGFGSSMPRLGSLVRNRLIELADSCVLYGTSVRDALIRKGYDPEKLFVAPNALDQVSIADAARYWTSGARLKEFRREHGIEDRRLLLYMSRIEREKKPDMLLEALRWVRAQQTEVELVFIGGGGLQEELRTAATRSNLAAAVRFLGPVYDEMRVAPWALSSLCMVQPEKLGLSILHAFGYGVPVITNGDRSSHGPEAEVLIDGVNSLLYRRGDVHDLATKIRALAGDDDLRRRLSQGALEVVRGPDGRNVPAMVAGLLKAIHSSATRSRERGQ